MADLEKIEHDGKLLAFIVRNNISLAETQFVSQTEDSFQVGLHTRPKGHRYKAHFCRPFENISSLYPNKIYLVKKGCLGIDFYDENKKKVAYAKLNAGDMINFTSGGHGVDIIDDAEFIEIKQGPYRGTEKDKEFLE